MIHEMLHIGQIIGWLVAKAKQPRKRLIFHLMWIFPCFKFPQIGGFDPSHTSIMSVSSINLIVLIMVSARFDESLVENDPLNTSATHEIKR